MSIISFDYYKEKFEMLLTDTNISETEFNSLIEDLVFQTPCGARQERLPILIRTSLLKNNETCSNISRCSYVPDHIKYEIPIQRCNLEGQQVFYASVAGGMTNFGDGAQPSLMETVAQKIIDDPTFNSREAAASRWQIKRQPLYWFLPHFANSVKSNENFRFLFNEFNTFLKKNCDSNENYQNFTEKLNYLSELFCSNSNKNRTYKITATYYNKVMNLIKPDNNSYEALIYPSANTNGEGMNIVLTKDYVDGRNIYCDLVVLYKINRNPHNDKDIWFLPYAQAIPDKYGNLEFKPIPKNMLH